MTSLQRTVIAFIFLAPVVFVATVLPTYHLDIRRLVSLSAEFPLLISERHPPLATWLAWFVTRVPFHDGWVAILAQLGLNLLAIWVFDRIARGFLEPAMRALLAGVLLTSYVMTLMATPGFSLNEDMVQIPIWAAAFLFLIRATTPQNKRTATLQWIILGVCLGLALLAKYYAIILVGALILTSLTEHRLRSFWLTSGPWLGLLAFAIVAGPHLYLLLNNPGSLEFAQSKMDAGGSGVTVLKTMLWHALLAPLIFLLPGLFFLWPNGIRQKRILPSEFKTLLIFTAWLLCLSSALALSGTIFDSRYQAPITGFVALCLAGFVPTDRAEPRLKWLVRVALVFYLTVYAIGSYVYLFGSGHGVSQEPGPALSRVLMSQWSAEHSCPPGYMLGHLYVSGMAAVYSDPPMKRLVNYPNQALTPSVISKISSEGGILLSKTSPDHLDAMRVHFKNASETRRIELPPRRQIDGPTVVFFYSFTPPKDCAATDN